MALPPTLPSRRPWRSSPRQSPLASCSIVASTALFLPRPPPSGANERGSGSQTSLPQPAPDSCQPPTHPTLGCTHTSQPSNILRTATYHGHTIHPSYNDSPSELYFRQRIELAYCRITRLASPPCSQTGTLGLPMTQLKPNTQNLQESPTTTTRNLSCTVGRGLHLDNRGGSYTIC